MAHEKAIDWKLADAAAKQDDINAADEEKLAALGYKQARLGYSGVSRCLRTTAVQTFESCLRPRRRSRECSRAGAEARPERCAWLG